MIIIKYVRRPVAAAFVAAFVLATLVAQPDALLARWVRSSAHACFPASLWCYQNSCIGQSVLGIKNLWNDDYADLMEVVCPVVDSSEFPKENIRRLNIHGQDNSTARSVSAQVCAAYSTPTAQNGGYVCSAFVRSGNSETGEFSLPLGDNARSIFTNRSTAFGYVSVSIPPEEPGTSVVYGVYQAD